MKILTTVALLLAAWGAQAQNNFNSCSAAFLDNKMIVNEYTPTGKCVLKHNATGNLQVAEVNLSEDGSASITNNIEFMLGIRDQNTKTIVMFSTEVYRKIDIQKVFAKSQKGDAIVILTLKNSFALPHNEILIQ
jgi:hypothetical protein